MKWLCASGVTVTTLPAIAWIVTTSLSLFIAAAVPVLVPATTISSPTFQLFGTLSSVSWVSPARGAVVSFKNGVAAVP